MTDCYAVFGNPIKHSLSPLIHGEFARQTGRDVSYQRQLVAVGEFASVAQAFFAAGGKGLNVTVPFKLDACQFASRLSERARRAGAVNTLALQGSDIVGDNTDGAGLVRDILANQGWQIEGKTLLLLGAGGAVRGVLEPLLAQRPSQLVIANRTAGKAVELANEFADLGNVTGCGFEELAGSSFDVIINGTSASLAGDLPPLPPGLVTELSCCYDMMYSATSTVFLQWAKSCGVTQLADGLGMLVEQAAEAFQLWQGVLPQTAPVIAHMRQHLEQAATP
jgi:shikimate dehydrogenase